MRPIVPLLLIATILCVAAVPVAAYPANITVTVTVLGRDATPAAGIPVFLQNGDYVWLGGGTTDASGACVFSVAPGSGAIRAVIRPGGAAAYNVSSVWYEAANTTIEVTLPGTVEVSGTVMLDGMGVGDPLVVVDDDQIYTSTPYDVSQQSGSAVHTFTANRFSFSAPVGDHSVYAVGYSNDTVYVSDRLLINVSASTAQVPLVLELKAAGSNTSILAPAVFEQIFHTSDFRPGLVNISGTLIGADGLPLASMTMIAQDYFLGEPASNVTDAAGAFSFVSLNLSTDIVRFKVVVQDNGTESQYFSRFYPVNNTSGLDVTIYDYPKASVGYVYGIITNSSNLSSPVALSGTVYLSNGLKELVSPDKNKGQFLFTLSPGTYEVYAVHQEGSERMVSEKVSIDVGPAWSPVSVSPTILVVQPEGMKPYPAVVAVALGLLCIGGVVCLVRRYL